MSAFETYRFRVLSQNGAQIESKLIEVDENGPVIHLAAPTWEHEALNFEHGDQLKLSAAAPGKDGFRARFYIETLEGRRVAVVDGKIEGGTARATLRVHHPLLPPQGPLRPVEVFDKAKPAKIRFRAVLLAPDADGLKAPAPEPLPAHRIRPRRPGSARSAPAQPADPAKQLPEAAWVTKSGSAFEHGSTVGMRASAQGKPEGARVRFVVETATGDAWKPHANVEGKVANGVAEAQLPVHHPLLPVAGKPASHATLKSAPAVKLRFRAELID